MSGKWGNCALLDTAIRHYFSLTCNGSKILEHKNKLSNTVCLSSHLCAAFRVKISFNFIPVPQFSLKLTGHI